MTRRNRLKTRHQIFKIFIEQIGWGILCLKLRREQKRTILNWNSAVASCSLANSEKLINEEVGKGDGIVETYTSDTSDTADTSDTLTPGEGGSCGAGGYFGARGDAGGEQGACQPLHLQLQE